MSVRNLKGVINTGFFSGSSQRRSGRVTRQIQQVKYVGKANKDEPAEPANRCGLLRRSPYYLPDYAGCRKSVVLPAEAGAKTVFAKERSDCGNLGFGSFLRHLTSSATLHFPLTKQFTGLFRSAESQIRLLAKTTREMLP